MKVGSKVAIYKLKDLNKESKKEHKHLYSATLVELICNPNKPFKDKRDYTFYNDCMIYSDIDLNEAIFDKEVPEKVIKYASGKVFNKKAPKYSFERISNPEDNCILRINEFEVIRALEYENGKPKENFSTRELSYKYMFYIKDIVADHKGYKAVKKEINEIDDIEEDINYITIDDELI